MIRQVAESDTKSIANIYNHYVLNTVATFEEKIISANEITRRIDRDNKLGLPWLVAERGGIVGYAYATAWSERSAYRHTVETTVYLSNKVLYEGWGTKLYTALFTELKDRNIHVVIGGITLPNDVSIALHEKFGMQKVAHFKQVGWLDVGYWQVNLNV